MAKAASATTTGRARLGISTGDKTSSVAKEPVKRAPKSIAPVVEKQEKPGQAINDTTEAASEHPREIEGHKIEYLTIPTKGGVRHPEKYPLSKLPLSEVTPNGIHGPALFIPDSDNPTKHVSAARKYARIDKEAVLFHARSAEKDGVPGKHIWRTSASVTTTRRRGKK